MTTSFFWLFYLPSHSWSWLWKETGRQVLAGVEPFSLGEFKANNLCTHLIATADVATDIFAAMKSFFQTPNSYVVLKSHLTSEQLWWLGCPEWEKKQESINSSCQSYLLLLFHPSPVFYPLSLPIQVDPSFIPGFLT